MAAKKNTSENPIRARIEASSIPVWCRFDELIDVTALVENPRNPNKHPDKQVALLAKIIRHQGWRQPITVSNRSGFIVKGHGRLQAARVLNVELVPVEYQDYANEAAEMADLLADNRIAELAEPDAGMISDLLADDVLFDGFDLDLTGFDCAALEDMMPTEATEGLTDEDEVPEVPDEPVAKLGQIWRLGDHRLMCGDSTDKEQVEKLMDGQKADMVFTSPPYNADAKAGQGDIFNKKKSVKLYAGGYSDNLPSKAYVDFAASVLEICFAVTDGFIFWNVSYNAKSRFEYIQQISNRLPYLVEQICWKKSSTIPFKGSLMRDWEPIYVFSTNKQPVAVKEVTSNFWQISNTGAQAENHKACFPVELPERGIAIVAKNTGIVFEPFGGSGSTLIACEKTVRHARLMELDPKYCDVIIKRWEDFTGKKAELISG